jgi:hypothetical protein
MSETFIASLSEIYRMLFLGSAALPMLYALFVYCKIYSVYRAIGDQASRLGFFWFSFQFQLPRLAKGMPNYLDLDSLPDGSRIQINGVRHQLGLIRTIFALWIVLVLALGMATALMRRHHS